MESAIKKGPAWGEGLPDFFRERLEAKGVRPTLRQFAAYVGMEPATLQRNIKGTREIRWETAKRIAEALDCTLDELAAHI